MLKVGHLEAQKVCHFFLLDLYRQVVSPSCDFKSNDLK